MRRFLATLSLSLLLFCWVPLPASAAPLSASGASPWALLTAWFDGLIQGVSGSVPSWRGGELNHLDRGPIWDPDGTPASSQEQGLASGWLTSNSTHSDSTSTKGPERETRTSGSFIDRGPIWDPDGLS